MQSYRNTDTATKPNAVHRWLELKFLKISTELPLTLKGSGQAHIRCERPQGLICRFS